MKCTLTKLIYIKILYSQHTIKPSFFFEYAMARRTICSSLETSNEIISIKVFQWIIKSSRVKVIRIYEAGGTGCLMKQTKTKKISYNGIYQLNFSNNLHEAICYSQELTKKICATFSMRSCPGKKF